MQQLKIKETKIGRKSVKDNDNFIYIYDVCYGNILKDKDHGQPLMFKDGSYGHLEKEEYISLLKEFLNSNEGKEYEKPSDAEIESAIIEILNEENKRMMKIRGEKPSSETKFNKFEEPNKDEIKKQNEMNKTILAELNSITKNINGLSEQIKNKKDSDSADTIQDLQELKQLLESYQENIKSIDVERKADTTVLNSIEQLSNEIKSLKANGTLNKDNSPEFQTSLNEIKQSFENYNKKLNDYLATRKADSQNQILDEFKKLNNQLVNYSEQEENSEFRIKSEIKNCITELKLAVDKAKPDFDFAELKRTSRELDHNISEFSLKIGELKELPAKIDSISKSQKNKTIPMLVIIVAVVSIVLNLFFGYKFITDNKEAMKFANINIEGIDYKVPVKEDMELADGKKIMIYGFMSEKVDGKIKNVAIPLGEFDLKD